jgi:lipoprotein-anchoring transpeptidase ErfK/SrfK
MRRLVFAFAVAFSLAVCVGVPSAQADVTVHISKATQRMSMSVDGVPRYMWRVSTGRGGYGTPSGVFRPQMLARSWFSRKYYNSPMPYSIFFHGGYAIHGTNYLSQLGGPASHGCVRLHPSNAAVLFGLVQRHRGNTRIIVS